MHSQCLVISFWKGEGGNKILFAMKGMVHSMRGQAPVFTLICAYNQQLILTKSWSVMVPFGGVVSICLLCSLRAWNSASVVGWAQQGQGNLLSNTRSIPVNWKFKKTNTTICWELNLLYVIDSYFPKSYLELKCLLPGISSPTQSESSEPLLCAYSTLHFLYYSLPRARPSCWVQAPDCQACPRLLIPAASLGVPGDTFTLDQMGTNLGVSRTPSGSIIC